jgi:hypothetical protein
MKWLKVGAVIFGAVLITALGIDAADTLSGSRSTLLGQVIGGGQGGICPSGMTEVATASTFKCVDIYEASPGANCPHEDPKNEIQSRENIESSSCGAVSAPEKKAWGYVTREQAVTACMRAGKRLPLSDEWYIVSVGTPDDASKCNTDSGGAVETGKNQECVSAVGAYDTIGNVWEWTSDDVIGGMHEGRELPEEGYVAQVDSGGVAVLTNPSPSELFYKDYLWSSKEGAFGILRGGFYGSRSDAGIYAVHARTLPTAAGTAIGFRCVL